MPLTPTRRTIERLENKIASEENGSNQPAYNHTQTSLPSVFTVDIKSIRAAFCPKIEKDTSHVFRAQLGSEAGLIQISETETLTDYGFVDLKGLNDEVTLNVMFVFKDSVPRGTKLVFDVNQKKSVTLGSPDFANFQSVRRGENSASFSFVLNDKKDIGIQEREES